MPSELRGDHHQHTPPDSFAEVWEEVSSQLTYSPGLKAKTLFMDLERRYPVKFQDCQLGIAAVSAPVALT